MKNNKIIFIFVLCFVFIMNIYATQSLSEKITSIRNGKITRLKDATNSILNADKELKKDRDGNYVYSFGLGCNLGENCISEDTVVYHGEVTSTEYDGETITISQAKEKWNNPSDGINPNNRWDNNGMNSGTASFTTDGAKNNYYAVYKNMGKYSGKDIDVKMTLIDFENISIPKYTVSASAVTFANDQIGVNVTGVKWVKIKLEFLDSQTGNSVTVKGNTTYWDIDQNQGLIINNDSSNKGIYYSNQGLKCTNADCSSEEKTSNQLYYALIDSSDIYIFDQNSGLDNTSKNNLYNDQRNSLAYAISEEFEGQSITRTIQYSNPVMINAADEENIWTGHGGMFVSSKNIEIVVNKYRITTEVENGRIDDSITVSSGESTIINYEPDEGYELSKIIVDGEEISLNTYIDSYLFSNVTSDHHIKVIYVKTEEEPDDPVEALKYKITTEVINGSIDSGVIVDSGENVTIGYAPKDGYTISEIIVDGKNVDTSNYKDAFIFNNVIANHHIKVVYISNPKTGISSPVVWVLMLAILSISTFIYLTKKQNYNSL